MGSVGNLPSVLFDQVSALVAVEQMIVEAIESRPEGSLPHPALDALLGTLQTESRGRQRTLADYLRAKGLEPATGSRSPITELLAEPPSERIALVTTYCTACCFAASEYSILSAMALRLYEPVLREVAPRHLGAHLKSVRLLTSLASSVVVADLQTEGHDCRCICPMCSIGVCGCTAAGRSWVEEAWRESRPEAEADPGFAITPPRRGSQMAEAGVLGGDRLIEADGEPVTDFPDVQRAIRQHRIGEELVLRVSRGGGVRDIRVRHVSDYASPG